MSTRGVPIEPGDPGASGWQLRFVEELAGLAVTPAASPAAMRVLAWMAVCEPREQTASQIQAQLDLSAGSVSSAVRMLKHAGVLEQAGHLGTRRVLYRFADGGWDRLFAARLRTLSALRGVADRAVDAAGPDATPRLIEMRDTSHAMEAGIATFLQLSGGTT